MTQQLHFQREIVINAPIDHVWQLVATEQGLQQWWGNKITFEAQEGGRCEEWQVKHGQTEHWQGVVTLYAPPHQLMFTLRTQEIRSNRPALTTIAISLEAEHERTRVHVSQRAMGASPTIDAPMPREVKPQPVSSRSARHNSPVAQLGSITPGTHTVATQPMATPLQLASPGHGIHADAASSLWQQRLDALLASASRQISIR